MITDVFIISAAGILAGIANAVAGGGTLISFPALLSIGIPALNANVTSSVGLISGSLGGSVGYRRELRGQRRRALTLGSVALAGGITGAIVLLVTPADSFRMIVPYLVLLSCVLLLVQPRLARMVASRRAEPSGDADGRSTGDAAGRSTGDNSMTVYLGVFVSGVYGSYFGAGLGVLLLAVMGIFIVDHLQRLNGLKSVLSMIVKAVGAAIFLFSGLVVWWAAGVLFVTGYGGGLLGAAIARRLGVGILRYVIAGLGIVVGIAMIVID